MNKDTEHCEPAYEIKRNNSLYAHGSHLVKMASYISSSALVHRIRKPQPVTE